MRKSPNAAKPTDAGTPRSKARAAAPPPSVAALIARIREGLAKEPGRAARFRGTFELRVASGPNGSERKVFHVILGEVGPGAKEPFAVGEGPAPRRPRAAIGVAARDLARILAREIDGRMAYMAGKLEVEGDLAFALSLQAALA
jgi:hypothetical protein